MCTVVNLVGLSTSNAQLAWNQGGFTGSVVPSPLAPPHYKIGWQSLAVATEVPCASYITVRMAAP
jgi:hypothetical protein